MEFGKFSSRKSKIEGKAKSAGNVTDYASEYNTFADDVVGEDSESDEEDKSKKSKRRGRDDDEEEKATPYMLFDFRKGKAAWPDNVELVDQKRAEELLEKAVAAAEEAAKMKKKDGDDNEDGGKKSSGTGSGGGNVSWDYDADATESTAVKGCHPEAVFETLSDGSQALIVKPGFRLKIDLSEMEDGGDEKKEERKKKKEREKKRFAKYKASAAKEGYGDLDDDMDIWDMKEGDYLKKYFKNYINAYTITMDIKLLEEPPREGISLFQTALIHSKENKRTGKTVLSKSDGECVISQGGGVGMFGTYGDTTKARVDVGCWRRVVVSVKCVEGANEKGEMRTWVNTEAGAVLKEDLIVANERFAIDPSALYFFSSSQTGMMPGNIAVRTIRVESAFSTDENVKANRARDKLSSVFDDDRKKEVEEQRKGLSLSSLFAKPRPMWVAPAFIAAFGDSFIERTSLEGNSNLAWSYTVLNYALQRMIKNPVLTGDFGLDYAARVGVADSLHIMQQSAAAFKLMLRMLKTPSESQLLSFLRKLKKLIQALNVGESLLLPGLVEGQELIILLERSSERQFKAVIVNTDALGGLQFHSASPTEAMPEIYYRTCMVLTEIPKKNVYDDVFWLAFYNMALYNREEDIVKFYDVLVPFLTGKPLESSLVEAERVARGLSAQGLSVESLGGPAGEDKVDDGADSDVPVSRLQLQYEKFKGSGSFRAPQRSKTAYVQCVFEALNFMLRSRGLTDTQAELVQFGLNLELVTMMKNDLTCMLPDESGVRVCSLALRELSRFAIQLVDKVERQGAEETKHEDATGKSVNVGALLTVTHTLVDSVNQLLSFCRSHDDDIPPALDLSAPPSDNTDPNHQLLSQFRDLVAWETAPLDADPGQDVALRKYIPVDLLQIPKKASTRREAIHALRMCDKLVTLIGNQSHCIKNDKFLILSVIEHLFIQVLPVPKPRDITLTEAELYTSGRAGRRAEVKEEKNRIKAEEKKKKLEEKKIRDEIENENRRRARKASGLDDDDADTYSAQDKSSSSKKSKDAKSDEKETPAPVKCFGEEAAPDFDIGKAFEKEVVNSDCIWDEPITYELQVELMLTLQRLSENFAAAAMSIQQSRPFDAVCIVVPGCIAALADALVRKLAIDEPSEFCSHLMGRSSAGVQLGHPGFGISAGSFATQSETIEIHCPELCIARTAVLDYFQSPQQQRLLKIFSWEEEFILKPGKNLIKLLRMLSRDIGMPIGRPNMLIVDNKPMSSLLMKNYPELRCYRDIAFWWKFFLNTDRKVFPNYVPLETPREVARVDRMGSQLDFNWDDNVQGYDVQSMGISLKCRPDPNQVDPSTGKPYLPEQLPTHRFPSTATPSFYVPLPLIRTEDDVIYRPNLPNFEDKFGQVLNQRDSELLISYLTVPYMRLPLLLSFFSTEDRIHKLQSKELRLILDSVLFEPGKYLRLDMCGVVPMMVPTSHPELLASSYGLLLNELVRSPETVLRSVLSLLKGALACDTGSVVDEGATEFNTSTRIILYMTRLGCRVDNYISFLIDWATKSHDCIDCPLRETDVSDEVLMQLREGLAEIRGLLDGQYHPLFEDYLRRLDVEVAEDPTNEKLIDRNSALACDLHSHKLLLYRNYHECDFKPSVATTLVGSFVYLTTRHTWNKSTTEGARLNMPETELYELLQVSRRRLINWLSSCKQGILDEVMQTALQVSSSLTGSLKASAEVLDSQNRWSRIKGERSCGRWAVGSSRTVAVADATGGKSPKALMNGDDGDADVPAPAKPGKMQRQVSYEKPVGEVDDTGMLGVEIDIQMGQMTLRSKHLAALATEIANHPDVMLIFGDATMQASLIERAEHRQKYRLVGLNHELHYWPSAHTMCPPLGDQWEREYDPKDLFDSERWIANLFEPIRLNFFNGPQPPPMQFLMPEKAISKEAEVVVLLGLHQSIGGPFKLVYLFRRLRVIHVYECVTQGREWWYSLHLTTDCRYTLREMQPSSRDRKVQYPDWWIRGSGDPYPMGVSGNLINDIDGISEAPASSVLVVREQQHHLNLSGGQETLVPSRLLFGVVPHALLDAYIFWQDESIAPRGTPVEEFEAATRGHKRLLGYPKADDGEYLIVIEFRTTGNWADFIGPQSGINHPHVVQSTLLPGRTVTITRKHKATFVADFQRRQRIAQLLESSKLLINPPPKKKVVEEDNDKAEMFKIDADVECDYEGKGVYWPCIVRRVNDNGTYDLEYVKDFKWVGVQRGVDPDIVQKRGEDERRKRGEGIWHWDGMSESEDEDWRANSDNEEEVEDPDKLAKSRLCFYHFDELNILLEAAGGDESACLAAISRLASVPGVLPFTDIHKLQRSIAELVGRDTLGFSDTAATVTKTANPEEEDMIMLNLLYAPRRTRLFSVMKTLTRLENASHICAWTRASNLKVVRRGPSSGLPYECPPIDLVELPRLKLAFTARFDHNAELRLYSVDHVDLFITNESNSFTAKLLAGIPHSLLLSNVRGEMQVLVPVIPPKRPRIAMEPFSTFIVLDRTKIPLAERFFLYPVHVSLSFLLTKGLNSAVYLMLLRFLHRDYAEVFRLADSIATDTTLNEEGLNIFNGFKNANDDWHPDAHACRLKISLVTIDSGTASPWDLTIECAKHTVKLGAVSSSCRLAPQEELQLLEFEAVVTSTSSPKYKKELHNEYSMALCFNRQQLLRGVLKRQLVDSIEVACRIPPRAMSSNWPYYQDNTVFGENYSQMLEITHADEGEHAWALEVKGQGGDETDAPPSGWLVVACFHTLWSAGCLKCMPAVTELVPMFQDMVNFLSVRADCQGMVKIARKFDIKTFPTFLILRGGQLVERIEGHERVVEKLVRTLNAQLKPSDKMQHSKHNHRIRTEKALLLGLEAPVEEVEERGQLDWTWDPDNCGEGMRVEQDGMQAIMGDEDADDDRVTWEYSYNNRNNWVHFPKDINKKLETKYKVGEMYSNSYYDSKYEIYTNNIEITSWSVTGWYGTEMSTYRTIYVRRNGDRLSVPGEEPYLTKEQKEKDKRSAEWREKLAAFRLKVKKEKVGKDIQGMRGTIGMLPKTGKHIWTLRVNHEPPRGGSCHGVGVCSDACESFGPAIAPLLGGEGDSGASLALYANGELFHNGKLLHTFAGSRNIPVVEDTTNVPVKRTESAPVEETKLGTENETAPVVTATTAPAATTETPPAPDFSTIVVGTLIEGNYKGNGRWFKGKVTKCKEDGTHLIRYEDGEHEDNVPAEFIRVFGSAAYAALQPGGAAHRIQAGSRVSGNYKGVGKWYYGNCIAKNEETQTFVVEYDDGEIEKDVTADRIKYVKKSKKDKKPSDENTVPVENRAPLFGRKSSVRVEFDSEEHGGTLQFFVDGVLLEGYVLQNVYKLLGGNEVFPCVCMCPFDLVDEATQKRKAEEAKAKADADAEAEAAKLREAEENGDECYSDEDDSEGEEEVEAEAEPGTTAEGEKKPGEFVEDEFPSITLLPHDDDKKKTAEDAEAAAAAAASKYESKYIDAKAGVVITPDGEGNEAAESKDGASDSKAESIPEGTVPDVGDAGAAAAQDDDHVEPSGNAEAKSGAAESTAAPAATEATTDKVVEVPIEKVRWMYETDQGWNLYSPAASRELEEALRDGKSEYTISIGNSSHKCNLDTKKQRRSDGDNESRMRRHVVGDGVSSLWEILSMKYEKPSNFLTGASIVRILSKIWDSKESMSGKEAGFGFLFLYSLLSGDMRCRIIGGGDSRGYGSGGGYGGYGPQPQGGGGSFSYGGKTVTTGSNDSHRFALLVTQLYSDKHTKSLPASIINVLGRNRQVSLRMPKFKDTRKATQTPFFNGWIDEYEPRSPLAELMGKVVPLMTLMKRKGAFHFPPPPPHAELPAAPTAVNVPLAPGGHCVNVDWDRPELSDFGCESRILAAVEPSVVGQLATTVRYRLGEDELKPAPPVAIEDSAHFEKVIKDAGDKIIVVDFFATWCGPCQSLAPVFKLLALQTPIATFLKVDVDVCDELAARFKIESMPHTVFMRGGSSPNNIHTAISGGGPEYVEQFFKVIASMSTEKEVEILKRFHSNTPGANVRSIIQNMSSDDAEVHILAKEPLKECFEFVNFLSREELGLREVSDSLAFDVSNHDSAKTAPAASVLSRFRDDVKAFAVGANTTKMPKMRKLTDMDVQKFFEGDTAAEETLKEALAGCKELMIRLQQLKDADTRMLTDLIPLLEKCSNFIETSEKDSDVAKIAKTKFILSRIAGQNSFVWVEFLFGALLSSKGEEDLLKLNPYLPASMLRSILSLVTTSMLRANRLGHTNRCIGTVISLESLLTKCLKIPLNQRAAQGPTLTPKLIQLGEDLSKNLSMRRYYMTELPSRSGVGSSNQFQFDPRYLVFEFVWNIQLRQKQVEIVNDFRECLASNRSKVKQMIMGAGKTSVVAPLLALIVADGKSLVLSVVPKALVEMSRTRMRETFAVIMVKRIYTLEFDRSTTVKPSMRRSLENAAANRGVVVATPTTLKSIMLSYLEVLQHLRDAHSTGLRSQLEALRMQAEELAKILGLFKEGVMLLDEVDLILHPLKSELNFPIGDKFDLDGSEDGERWGLPIHLIDALFFTSTGKVSSFEQRGVALDVLKRLAAIIQQGIADRHLQRLPHVTLLNPDFYHSSIKPIMAEWAYLWLQKQHLHGIDRGEAVRYMLEGAAARSDNTNKFNLIDLALKKAQVDAGVQPLEPSPTRGFVRSVSTEVRDQVVGTMRKLQRSRSENVSANQELNATLHTQIRQLEVAKKSAADHQQLVNDLYGIDEVVEGRSSNTTKLVSSLQSKIELITKQIGEIECPRDDSLDNCVIVWCSVAFSPAVGGVGAGASGAANASGSGSGAETSVPAVCTVLEDMGFTVKRCADAEEAISRARDLQAEHQLRCVIIGGDEKAATCGPSCNKAHLSGNCVKCGRGWGGHSGHNCMNGSRGAWPIEGPGGQPGVKSFNAQQMYKTLTDEETPYARANGALPAVRTAVYTAHATMKEEERMGFWTLGTYVTDDHKSLVEWVSTMPSWTATAADAKAEAEEEEGEGNVDGTDADDLKPSGPVKVKRESSLIVDKNRIAALKEELEKLENEKASILDQDEAQLKVSQGSAAEKNAELEHSVAARVEILASAEEKLRNYVTTFNARIPASKVADYADALSKLWMGPHNGRDAALALAWLEVHHRTLDDCQNASSDTVLDEVLHRNLMKHSANVSLELGFLRQLALAAKVVAHVTSPAHKKLLNLCHNWLATFLPHCLAKVNRVSFGLLSAEDCKAALEADPHVPRSRLKLAVPFVGKDVPSKSSEFAHPDVIIGLTVLAYRYSGLRFDDFIDLVDALTSQFSVEIGPARDRESSLRHEKWVHAAGGAIRGLKTTKDGKPWAITVTSSADPNASKEVVQLKFLQKSNEEQMQKLFDLITLEPSVIHYYLQKTIFPLHMRSQRTKLSASGQAVGGDMLVGKRVGFSGTPSDLLPQELGRCDYETGDDGMMITTVLDRKVASFEYLKDQWTVEHLLEHIATSESPRFNALIDTGALITGYSNQEVAQQLLNRGLTWCEGVVFLDDNDRQQVLVRATGRIVSADQCGVSLERRFAFYDQIHTTGMDIKHVVNATAVITLGKDMVFRDYVQGAYRMRGIGAGQKVHVFVIPEVKELINRELKDCVIVGPSGDPQEEHVLEDVVAWLVVNSLRSEQTQWTMLCLQNIGNLYRKQAFRALHKNTSYFADGLCALNLPESGIQKEPTTPAGLSIADLPTPQADVSGKHTIAEIAASLTVSQQAKSTQASEEEFVDNLDKKASLALFDESIDFSLDAGVPDPIPFAAKLSQMLDEHEGFLLPHQHAIGHNILVVVGQFSMLEGSANRLDTEQEREQEQEQEKEVEARRDQQIEVEKFVDREYSRQEELQRPWPFSMLAKDIYTPGIEHPFYKLCDFKLRHQDSLAFDETLFLSSNYFNPNWTGLRRVKNVVMLLEYAPSTDISELRLRTSEEARVVLTADQEIALRKAHSLLGFHANLAGRQDVLNRTDIRNAVGAVLDIKEPAESLIDEIITRFSSDKEYVTLDEFREILACGFLYPKHKGRNWVAVSLAEAETIRRILHLRKRCDNQHIIPNSSTELALRYSPISGQTGPQYAAGDGGVVFDASWGWQRSQNGSGATPYEASVAHSSFRFFDCDMHFSEASLNILVQVLRSNIRDRERFFLATIGCRRRMERKWQDTPLAKVFQVPDEWISLKQKAQALFVIEALKSRNLTLWEAFTAFDYDNNGMLSPAEFYGALRWLNVPHLTAEDVVDFLEAVDKNRDGMIDYKEYMDMLAGAEDVEESSDSPTTPGGAGAGEDTDKVERVPIAKVDPYGAEELREIMIRRKQAELARLREDRIRRQAYKDALDVKVFEEELEACKKRKGGANPLVFTHTYKEPVKYVIRPPAEAAAEGTPEAATPDASTTVTPKAEPAVVENEQEALPDAGITGPLTVTDFKFFTNQLPLRCAVTGKSTFYPIHTGTIADRPVKPMKCKRNHAFTQYNYYWACCDLCKKQSTAWACWSCSNFVCSVCYDGDKKGKEAERRDPAKHPTFLRCANGASFTVQIPAAGGANSSTAAIGSNAQGSYSVTLEMRIEKHPPKGNLASLLRFTTPDATQQRSSRLHRASVFINPEGRVVGRPLLTTVAPPPPAAAPAPTEPALGSPDKDAPAPEAAPAAAQQQAPKHRMIVPGKWTIVTVCVQPEAGTVHTYINGALSHVATDLDAADLRLQHKLVVFGGGKQAQSKGGDIRRLQVHNAALSPTEVMAVFLACAHDNPGLGGRWSRVQAVYRGFHYRKVIKDAEAKEKAEQEALEAAERAKAEEVEKALAEAAAATAAATAATADGDGAAATEGGEAAAATTPGTAGTEAEAKVVEGEKQ